MTHDWNLKKKANENHYEQWRYVAYFLSRRTSNEKTFWLLIKNYEYMVLLRSIKNSCYKRNNGI